LATLKLKLEFEINSKIVEWLTKKVLLALLLSFIETARDYLS